MSDTPGRRDLGGRVGAAARLRAAAAGRRLAALLLAALCGAMAQRAAAEEATLHFAEDRAEDGKAVLEALAKAWPGRISGPERFDGDWAVRVDDTWYRWAGGRLLPALFRGDEGAWSPWPFYSYPERLPPVTKLDEAQRKRLASLLLERDRSPPRRYPAFYDQLWHSRNEKEAWDRAKTLRFLGREILVSPDLLEEFVGIERSLRARAKTDPAVAAWVAGIGSIEGYAWRSVQGTSSRSMHSYGAAIDVVPKNSKALSWYWVDARESGLAWYELPYSRRIAVPEAVVTVFEDHGFIWGGKWFYWDLVHFEYRPEILVLNGSSPLYQAPIE